MKFSSFQRILMTTCVTVAVFALLLMFKPAGPERGAPPGGAGFPPGVTQAGTR